MWIEPYGKTCQCCRGAGRVDLEWDDEGDPTKTVDCGECEGRGMYLTDLGDALLNFLKKITDYEERKHYDHSK